MAISLLTTGLGGSGGTALGQLTLALRSAFVSGSCVVTGLVLQDTTRTNDHYADDTTGGPMTLAVRQTKSVTGARLELWSTAINGGLNDGTYLQANFTGALTSLAAGAMSSWSNVLALGANATANNTNADPTISLVTQDANNVVVAVFATVGGTLPTSKTGTLRETKSSDGGSPVVCSIVDNTAASASSVTCALTLAATTWAAIIFELRSVAPAGSIKMRKTLGGLGTAIGKRQLQW